MFQGTLALSPADAARPIERTGFHSWDEASGTWHNVLSVQPAAGRAIVVLQLVMTMAIDGSGSGGMQIVNVRLQVGGVTIEGFNGQPLDNILHPEDAGGIVRIETYIYVPDGEALTLEVLFPDSGPAAFTAHLRGVEVTPAGEA